MSFPCHGRQVSGGHNQWGEVQGLQSGQLKRNNRVRMSEIGAVQEAHLLLLAAVSPSPPAALEGADQLNMMDSGSWSAI